MWALINGETIQVGPREWNRWVFQEWIQENLDLLISLPQQKLDNDVISVSDTVNIVPVVMDADPSYNSKTQALSGPELVVTSNLVTGSYQVVDLPAYFVQNTLLDHISSVRYNQEISGTTAQVQGQTVRVATDRVSRTSWTHAVIGGGDSLNWKFDNSTWLTLSNSDIQAVSNAILAHVNAAFDWEKSISEQIQAAQDLATLDSIDLQYPVAS
jgi:hypothetical protein